MWTSLIMTREHTWWSPPGHLTSQMDGSVEYYNLDTAICIEEFDYINPFYYILSTLILATGNLLNYLYIISYFCYLIVMGKQGIYRSGDLSHSPATHWRAKRSLISSGIPVHACSLIHYWAGDIRWWGNDREWFLPNKGLESLLNCGRRPPC